MTEEKRYIMDNECEYVDLLQFIEKLKKEKELKKFYILSIGVWIKYFEKCIKNRITIEKRFVLDRIHDLTALQEYFSEKEWPELCKTKKNVEKFLTQIVN